MLGPALTAATLAAGHPSAGRQAGRRCLPDITFSTRRMGWWCGVPVWLGPQPARRQRERSDDHVRHRLWPADGLRGLPDVPGKESLGRHQGSPRGGRQRLASTRRVISAATLIMIAVFSSFVDPCGCSLSLPSHCPSPAPQHPHTSKTTSQQPRSNFNRTRYTRSPRRHRGRRSGLPKPPEHQHPRPIGAVRGLRRAGREHPVNRQSRMPAGYAGRAQIASFVRRG